VFRMKQAVSRPISSDIEGKTRPKTVKGAFWCNEEGPLRLVEMVASGGSRPVWTIVGCWLRMRDNVLFGSAIRHGAEVT
jgi:hypothetical protein